MPRAWCWFVIERPSIEPGIEHGIEPGIEHGIGRGIVCGIALALGLLAGATSLNAATVLERRVIHEIRADGSVEESTVLKVRLDEPADLDAWAGHAVYLDENRTLEDLDARVRLPDGKTLRVRAKHQDTLELSGPTELHSSASYRTLEFPGLEVGATVEIEHRIRTAPYFPAGRIALIPYDDPTAVLEIEVRGAPSTTPAEMPLGWRWRVDGEPEGLTIEETAGGVRIRGSALAAPEDPDSAPSTGRGVLRYAWGDARDWPAVARWYHELSAESRRSDGAIRALAHELTAGVETPRERLDALARFVQSNVRYVAVQVGIGGYRPSLATETLERRWGDCKDKSFLLLALLREVGIDAHPVLLLADPRGRVDAEFATPFQFNHLIVAVPVDGMEVGPDDPVAEGLLFLDPTQTLGASRWLHPSDQDQDVLVVTGDGGRLVRTPNLVEAERQHLTIDLRVDEQGTGTGRLSLKIRGRTAAAFFDVIEARSAKERDEFLRQLMGRLLPGSRPGEITWTRAEGAHPEVTVEADLRLGRWIGGAPGRRSFQVESAGMASVGDLAERDLAYLLEPALRETVWRLRLPESWCPARLSQPAVRNEVGSFVQEMTQEGDVLTVRRTTRIEKRWIEPGDFDQLEELSLADQRAQRRRIRLRCDPPASPGT